MSSARAAATRIALLLPVRFIAHDLSRKNRHLVDPVQGSLPRANPALISLTRDSTAFGLTGLDGGLVMKGGGSAEEGFGLRVEGRTGTQQRDELVAQRRRRRDAVPGFHRQAPPQQLAQGTRLR